MNLLHRLYYHAGVTLGKSFFFEKPTWQLTDEKKRIFALIFDAALYGENQTIDYDCNFPKWQFLDYIINEKDLVLHGSNVPKIDVMEPREQTDYAGNKVKAVFATRDSIWSIFFSILDLENYRGSLRNVCWVIQNEGKAERRFYFFSLNQDPRGHNWMNGLVYILPAESFRPASTGVVRFDEWLSDKQVTPIARLPVTAMDFPMIEKVVQHDDRESMIISWLRYKRRATRSSASKLA